MPITTIERRSYSCSCQADSTVIHLTNESIAGVETQKFSCPRCSATLSERLERRQIVIAWEADDRSYFPLTGTKVKPDDEKAFQELTRLYASLSEWDRVILRVLPPQHENGVVEVLVSKWLCDCDVFRKAYHLTEYGLHHLPRSCPACNRTRLPPANIRPEKTLMAGLDGHGTCHVFAERQPLRNVIDYRHGQPSDLHVFTAFQLQLLGLNR